MSANIKFRPSNTNEKPQMFVDIELEIPKLKENKDLNKLAFVVEMSAEGVHANMEAIKKFVAMWDAHREGPQDDE